MLQAGAEGEEVVYTSYTCALLPSTEKLFRPPHGRAPDACLLLSCSGCPVCTAWHGAGSHCLRAHVLQLFICAHAHIKCLLASDACH